MRSARIFGTAALLSGVLSVTCTLLVVPAASAQTASKASTSKRTTKKAGAHSVRRATKSGTARGPTRRVVVTRRKVHGRWVRSTQVVKTNPVPTYQIHPDPERYQQIQQALATNGYFKGEANGQWGDDSVDALKRFQTDHNLPNDGKISALSLIDMGLGPTHNTPPSSATKAATVLPTTLVPAPPPAVLSSPETPLPTPAAATEATHN